jgi:hypothetical protein
MTHERHAVEGKQPPTKRIILLLDGTWNDEAFGNTDTNIVRLQQIIAKTLDKEDNEKSSTQHPLVRSFSDKEGVDNIVYYERGVGTGWRDRYTGGIFGDGLNGKIRSAYLFLSYHYDPGAEIFIFGFSRGSYTARSLVGYIAATGLLKRDTCTPENEHKAWRFYREPPGRRSPGVWSQLQPLMNPLAAFKIDCLGVFDTVGALGIPLQRFKLLNRDDFEFHDVDLSSITKVNLHAVAIDEHRNPFEASMWRKPRFKKYRSAIEQVWFPGVHSDVGGGYIPELERERDKLPALDDITLDWMLKRVHHHCPGFPADPEFWPPTGEKWKMANQHESRDGIYRFMRRTIRSIANYPLKEDEKAWYDYNGCYDRHAVAIGEKVHISALLRLGETVATNGLMGRYAPPNLISALPVILDTYKTPGGPPLSGAEICVVDWSGRQFERDNDKDRLAVQEVVTAAQARLAASYG